MTRKTKALAVIACTVSTVIAGVPWLVPLARFIPEFEMQAAGRLGEPVRIESLHLYLLPTPHVTARGITAGKVPMLEVGSLTVTPNLLYLFTGVKVLSEVRLERVTVKQDFLRRLANLPTPETQEPPAGWRVQRIVVESGELRLRAGTLRDVNAEASLGADGVLDEIRLSQDGGHLRIVAKPEGRTTFRLQIAGRDWKFPAGPALLFERLDGTALLTNSSIVSRNLVARVYGGRVAGPVAVSWKPDWSISSDLSIEGVQLQPLMALFSKEHAVSGRLTGSARVALRAMDPMDLPANMDVEGDFTIEAGTLSKVDLVAATRSPFSNEAGKGGSTRFEELSGHLIVDREGYHVDRLKVASGSLAAGGDVSIGRDQRLSGRIDAELKGTASLISVPLQVTGTLQEPRVSPTKGAMAGAVAGSIFMPGVGTAVGIKAGQLVEKLLGQLAQPRSATELAAARAQAPEAAPARR